MREKFFFTVKKKFSLTEWSKKIIFWYFWVFLRSFTWKTPENLKKQSVSIIVSIFVKKISPNNVRDFFFLLFIREKKICLWTLWNFSWPSATRNFKIGFTRKCSSHSWTGEKRSLTVGEIFFTQKRDNYTNKVLFLVKQRKNIFLAFEGCLEVLVTISAANNQKLLALFNGSPQPEKSFRFYINQRWLEYVQ